jgi:hypothetical protein
VNGLPTSHPPLHPDPQHPTFIFTGTVVARKALREVPHRFAASELDPRRLPGSLAAMSSRPQPATQIPVSPAVGAPEHESKPTGKRPLNPTHLLPFPRTRSRTVPDVKNDHFVAHDFIHDHTAVRQLAE